MLGNLKIALVTDWLVSVGGGERVLISMLELFPNAVIYTTVLNREKLIEPLKSANIVTSRLQKRKPPKNHRKLLPFMPSAVEEFDFTGYDIVISLSSCVAKGIVTPAPVLHICYCHTPMRYIWDFASEQAGKIAGKGRLKSRLLSYFLTAMRIWDYSSAARVDYFIANSHNVAARIRKHYRRDSEVIHPHVKSNFFVPSDEDGGYFLVVSRLQEYKRVDLAIEACNRLKLPLVVVGDGPMREELCALAGSTVKMVGRADDNELAQYYAKCRAAVFPQEEDFGIVPLEAMSCGRPVIAYGKGGALETVVEGKTGLFFGEQTPEALVEAIKKFQSMSFDKESIREHAVGFDEVVFKAKIKLFVEQRHCEFTEGRYGA